MLLDGIAGLADRGATEPALRCAKDLLAPRDRPGPARSFGQRVLVLLGEHADLRAERQLGRASAPEMTKTKDDLVARSCELVADIVRFLGDNPSGISADQAARAAVIYQRALDVARKGATPVRRSVIFISYRRDDSGDATSFIAKGLLTEFGEGAIFMDVDSIPIGVDYRTYIVATLARCRACLVVIGPDWLSLLGASGKRRIDEANDLVRIEIETALSLGVPVAPLVVRGARVPEQHELPMSIAGLATRNGQPIR
jgi:hypothetical protein